MRYSGFAIEQVRTQSPGVVQVRGFVTTTTSGTVGSYNVFGGGATVTKTAAKTGRYTITLTPPAAESVAVLASLTFMGGYATLVGPDDAALTNSKGVINFFRDDDISTTGAKDGTIELQWTLATGTAQADTEVQDGASFYFCIDIGSPAVT